MASTFPDLVVSYLKSLENRGIVQIPIDDEARSVLRKWVISARAAKASISPTPAKLPPRPMPGGGGGSRGGQGQGGGCLGTGYVG